jgi:hypothetical protein
MHCYSLPFGVLGFISHVLTYYTITVLSTGSSPLRPQKLLAHPKIALCLSSISLVGGFATSVFTLVRCRSYWQLVVIAFWKLSTAVLNGAVGVHIAIIMRKFLEENKVSSWHPI